MRPEAPVLAAPEVSATRQTVEHSQSRVLEAAVVAVVCFKSLRAKYLIMSTD